jgi:hypothetical protein
MNSTTVKKLNLTDADLAALFISNTTSNDSVNTLDESFLNQMTDSIIDQQTIGPPPGFENFRFDTSNLLTTNLRSSISNAPPVSSSDTINFSQLLQSTTVGKGLILI